jgi:hypothetical protein
MEVRYFIDPQTGLPHIYKHDVSEAEVEDVLNSPGEDRAGRDGCRIAIGYTSVGRLLRVIYVRETRGAFVLTAYDLTGKPAMAFRRRRS